MTLKIPTSTLHIIFLILLVMKLAGLTTVSWWWVFAPFLIPFGLVIVGIIIYSTIKVLQA